MSFERLQLNWPHILAACAAIGAIAVFVERLFTIRKLALEIRQLNREERTKDNLVQPANSEEVAKYGWKPDVWRTRVGSPWLSIVHNSIAVVVGVIIAIIALERSLAALVVAALLLWNAYQAARTVRSYRWLLSRNSKSS